MSAFDDERSAAAVPAMPEHLALFGIAPGGLAADIKDYEDEHAADVEAGLEPSPGPSA
jgi:hypothetical protein